MLATINDPYQYAKVDWYVIDWYIDTFMIDIFMMIIGFPFHPFQTEYRYDF